MRRYDYVSDEYALQLADLAHLLRTGEDLADVREERSLQLLHDAARKLMVMEGLPEAPEAPHE